MPRSAAWEIRRRENALSRSLSEVLRCLRVSREVSMRSLARAAGVSVGTVSHWEAGQCEPRIPELRAVLDALAATDEQRQAVFDLMHTPRAEADRQQKASLAVGSELLVPSTGQLIRALRLRSGASLNYVASHLGVQASTVTRWEQSKVHPGQDKAQALLALLQADPAERDAVLSGRLENAAHDEPAAEDSLEWRLTQLKHEASAGRHALMDLDFLVLEAQLWKASLRRAATWSLLAEAYTWHAQWLLWRGRIAEAGRCAFDALELVKGRADPQPFWLRAVHVASNAIVDSHETPKLKRGVRFVQSWLPASQWPETTAWMYQNIATYAMRAGDIEYARRLDEEADRLVEASQDASAIRNTHFDSAVIRLRSGRPEEAHRLLSAGPQPNVYHRIYEEQMWTETLLALGEKDEAYARLEQTYSILHECALSPRHAEPFAHWAVRWRSLF